MPGSEKIAPNMAGYITRICLLALALCSLAVPSGLAQTTSAPLDLGTIIQKKTKGAPPPRVYRKLPKTVPIPASKPAANTSPSAAVPAPGQIAPISADGASNPAAPARTQMTPGQAPVNEPSSTPAPMAVKEPAKPAQPEIQPGGTASLQLTALLSTDGQLLQRGINWRIYEEKRDKNGRLPMLHNSVGGQLSVDLSPGKYIVYAGYGYANLTKRLVLAKAGTYQESFVLQAGAVRLNAVAAGDMQLDGNLLRFDIYTREGEGSTQELIVKNVSPQSVVKLTEGTYHIVSRYGTSNAKIRGDIEIEAGKLVSVTMIHNAAKVTLRLVSEPGGEALANTVWTVLTPGGDVVKRAIGAFPTLALAAGDYTAIAKQNDEVYNRDFSVDSGLDRSIEVLAKIR